MTQVRTSSVAASVAAVRAEPDDTAEQVTQVLRGEPLTVDERRAGWARIRTAYDYPGWIREDALGDGHGSLPKQREGDPVEEARAYLGAPYEWGGMTERGIDCSGLIHMAYRRLGRLVPRDADQQEAAAAPIAEADEVTGACVRFVDRLRSRFLLVSVARHEPAEPAVSHMDEAGAVDAALGHAAPFVWRPEVRAGRSDDVVI